jgi:hypothetical protein
LWRFPAPWGLQTWCVLGRCACRCRRACEASTVMSVGKPGGEVSGCKARVSGKSGTVCVYWVDTSKWVDTIQRRVCNNASSLGAWGRVRNRSEACCLVSVLGCDYRMFSWPHAPGTCSPLACLFVEKVTLKQLPAGMCRESSSKSEAEIRSRTRTVRMEVWEF